MKALMGEFMIPTHCTGAVFAAMTNEACSGVSGFIGVAYDAMIQAKIDGGSKTVLAGRS